MADPFTNYSPVEGMPNFVKFTNRSGKSIVLTGPAAQQQMQQIDQQKAMQTALRGGAPEAPPITPGDPTAFSSEPPALAYQRTDAPAPGNAHLPQRAGTRAEQLIDTAETLRHRPGDTATDSTEAFVRGAIPAAFNTAALPVTLAGRAAEAAGFPNAAAHLNADEALGDVEWIRTKVSPEQYRQHMQQLREEHPTATAAGQTAGELVGSAPLLMAGGAAGHALEHAAKGGGAAVRALARTAATSGEGALGGAAAGPQSDQTKAYLANRELSNEELGHAIGHHAMIGATLASGAGAAGVAGRGARALSGEAAGAEGAAGAEAEASAMSGRVKNIAEPSVSTEIKLQPDDPHGASPHGSEQVESPQHEPTIADRYNALKSGLSEMIDKYGKEAFTARVR